MRITLRTAVVLALTLSVSTLSAQQFQRAQNGQAAPFGEQARQQAEEPKFEVVALVNGDAITRPELEARLREQQQQQLRGNQVDPEKVREQTLDSLIESRLIEQHVIEKGPDVKSQEVDSVVGRLKQQLDSQDGVGFDQFLASRGYTEQSFKKRIEGSIGWRKYQQQQMQPEKLQQYFQQNKDQFQANSFEEAQQDVMQAYTAALWGGIVQQMKPAAEIEVRKEALAGSDTPQQQPAPQATPQ